MPTLTLFIPGTPAPQGSKRAYHNPKTGRTHLVETSKKLPTWRKTATTHTQQTLRNTPTWNPTPTTPIHLDVTFHMPRPKHHYGTGRNNTTLKPTAPTHHTQTPDRDKLLRAISDALTDARAIHDDKQLTTGTTTKTWANTPTSHGAHIHLTYQDT